MLKSTRTVRSTQHCVQWWSEYEEKWGSMPEMDMKICESCRVEVNELLLWVLRILVNLVKHDIFAVSDISIFT